MTIPRVSVIIPVWNDAASLSLTLDYLFSLAWGSEVEVIVAACGGEEDAQRAVTGRARLLWPGRSTRAALMNAGAAAARGEILFFLHADSFPPATAIEMIQHSLSDNAVVGGAFEHLFADPGWSLRTITWINRVRCRLTRNYYGDQGMFVRASLFYQMGGYKDMALLEDLDFSQRLKGMGRTVLIHLPLLTSGRRFLARGPWRTFFFITWLLLLHTLRLNTQRYAERWRGPGDSPPGSPWPRGHLREATRPPIESGDSKVTESD